MNFGKATKEYNISKLQRLVMKGKIDEAKDYMNAYFVKTKSPPASVLHWSPALNKLEILKLEECKKTYFNVEIRSGGFDYRKWFFNGDAKLYILNVDPTKPLFYKKNDARFINLFGGYLHREPKRYVDFSDKIKEKVKQIWKHIKEVWCSENQDSFRYVKKWIMNMICGKKNTTALYLKAGEGVGKSIITDFLTEMVLGKSITYTTSEIDVLLGSFNISLLGKLMYVFEELPNTGPSQWRSLSNHLKHLITGKTLVIKEKHKNEYETTNHANFIINTNNNAIKLSIDSRRYACLDISNRYVGNTKYFKGLSEATKSKKVGEAFYAYCLANRDEDFNETVLPVTKAMVDNINDNMPNILTFIKTHYLLVDCEENINESFAEFYRKYGEAFQNGRLQGRKESNICVSRILKSNNINLTKGGKNILYFRFNKTQLLKVFETKHWIHEMDYQTQNYNEEEVTNQFIDDDLDIQPAKIKQDANNEILLQLKQMKDEIEKLKNENKQLKQEKDTKTELEPIEKELIKKKKENNERVIQDIDEEDDIDLEPMEKELLKKKKEGKRKTNKKYGKKLQNKDFELNEKEEENIQTVLNALD